MTYMNMTYEYSAKNLKKLKLTTAVNNLPIYRYSPSHLFETYNDSEFTFDGDNSDKLNNLYRILKFCINSLPKTKLLFKISDLDSDIIDYNSEIETYIDDNKIMSYGDLFGITFTYAALLHALDIACGDCSATKQDFAILYRCEHIHSAASKNVYSTFEGQSICLIETMREKTQTANFLLTHVLGYMHPSIQTNHKLLFENLARMDDDGIVTVIELFKSYLNKVNKFKARKVKPAPSFNKLYFDI